MRKTSNDGASVIAFSMKAAEFTSRALQNILREWLNSHSQKQHAAGLTTLSKLERETQGGTLENVPITEKNIAEFQGAARKYNVSYALKRDNTADPPTWYVFFKNDKQSKDNIEKAFKEFADKQLERKDPVIEREKIKDIALEKPRPEREPEREKEIDKDIAGNFAEDREMPPPPDFER